LPVQLLIETHPAGGLHDMVELLFSQHDPDGDGPGLRMACNRARRVHILGVDDQPQPRDLLEDLDHGLHIASEPQTAKPPAARLAIAGRAA
jgi:hypothetical protein